MREEKDFDGSGGPSPCAEDSAPVPGKPWREFEIGGQILQMTEPELTWREEPDKSVCRVEYLYRWVKAPQAQRAPEASSPEGPK